MNPHIDDPAERDTPMTGTYVGVVLIEAAIIVLLWVCGKVFS